MQPDQSLFEQIDAFLDEKLSVVERANFQHRMEESPTLWQEVETIRQLREGIALAGLRDDLERAHRQVGSGRIFQLRRNAILAIAASVALLLTFYFVFQPFASDPGLIVFREYFRPDPGLPSLMGATDRPEFNDAMVDYKLGKYAQAIDGFESLWAMTPNDTLAFYLGVAYLSNGQPREATPFLEKVSPSAAPLFAKSRWYLAMAHLRASEPDRAREILRAIAGEPDHPFSTRAAEALTKLSPQE